MFSEAGFTPAPENIHSNLTCESFEKKANKPKPESEDAQYSDVENGIFAVADGVSRSSYGEDYSPAARASREAVRALGENLAELIKTNVDIQRQEFIAAFLHANEAVGQVNRNEVINTEDGDKPLWEATDFYINDLAGTVAVVAVKQGGVIKYAFIAACA